MTPAALLASAALLLVPGAAGAQPRPFSCVGAEQLEDDVFEIPFARAGEAAPPERSVTVVVLPAAP
jgi:hypothetical protein